jgi:hypothetical protein
MFLDADADADLAAAYGHLKATQASEVAARAGVSSSRTSPGATPMHRRSARRRQSASTARSSSPMT